VSNLGLTKETLHEALFVALKAKMPRLRVDSSCEPAIYFDLNLARMTTQGQVIGFSCNTRFEVNRRSTIIGVDGAFLLTVWEIGGISAGPTDQARSVVLGALDEYLTRFSAAYYRAGNP
jgi:hypothetical protein